MIIVGSLLIFSGIILGVVGAAILNIPFIRMDLVPIGVGFCGVMLLGMGITKLVDEKKTTKAQLIEENDARNIVIRQNAKSRAFDLMLHLFGFGLLVLAMFDYLNKVSFFSLLALYYSCYAYYLYCVQINKENM
ncbi:hypothetical protein AMS59_01475 [Lysinibacillus sp. FJAT-14745]|uniref:hypothetical protein n=1 Tax=Lysinibacillus sp. FJAT-14745 TaxID=1704289 RepID=UPI0006BEE733|nr:hypothetical protein [Lysinibacillus sp. FJAT-14745]KOP80110.1 hypothetical protein AMS59_01475 [Lysinibacillus sp. FJAT-14745]